MVEILALVLQHDEDKVEQAVVEALESDQVSKQHVINCLSRLLEPPRPPILKLPKELLLIEEPKANTDRYDNLRENPNVI